MAGRIFRISCLMPAVILMCLLAASCGSSSQQKEMKTPVASMPDTLRVGTLYSPTTYFIYRDEPMGYEYDMVKQYAESHSLPMKLVVAPSFHTLVEMLDSGKIDLLACRVPMTSDFKNQVRFCGPVNVTAQVLVQKNARESGDGYVDNVTGLVGRDVYVETGTKYCQRLENLNEEVGGGINIHALASDTLVAHDLVEMVAQGEVPFTVVDGDIASLEKTYYHNIDVNVAVSLEQKSAWAVAKDNEVLANSIDKWSRTIGDNNEVKEIHRRYFEMAKNPFDDDDGIAVGSSGAVSNGARMIDATTISQYDAFFRKYAPSIDWDWRLLAAVAYEESRFDNSATSWAGAAGVMQIMPRTAALNGLPASQIRDPERNIATCVRIFKILDDLLRKKVPSPDERLKFVLASYNAGQGHILDAIALAGKYGMDNRVWDSNVRDALLMKSRQEYYTDPVVRHGYFHAKETVSYVDRVLRTYDYYKAHAPA